MSAKITLPAGADIRTSMIGTWSYVTIAPAGLPCDFGQVMGRGRPAVHQLLTHDAGTTWPDRTGCRLANAVLERGDSLVVAQFERLADALTFRKRLGDPPDVAGNDL